MAIVIFSLFGILCVSMLVGGILEHLSPKVCLFTPEQVINSIKQGFLEENSGDKGTDLASIITKILVLKKIKKVKKTTSCQTKDATFQYFKRLSKVLYVHTSSTTYDVVWDYINSLTEQEKVAFLDQLISLNVLSNEEFYSGTF
ncbi:hypothetical protein AB4455_10625 [Vibrio sp. 10N.261.46.E12]|uniref:hypothetical protein n=1 Tax=unclassified Vibrio TaxID=2614977 RepID=UPI0009772EE2|nr:MULTISPECIES: hypothetical protein [unclassified Vibrio]OMO36077.1 hypothetical protein BH584_04695 [Vibrio sp. 10N.261.45.E1]PMJ34571.1 hypothetical protein BCU27_03840 [Vibrio sp. 10N.286.45.B6]PML88099.1 hypothetical protein BCT66_10910 [Vibrio sp. 10N.261.49.E11]PMM67427.1 hypothetical protein BCT48_15385 [Vibrio sp. 10N.261.46.F12]PMM81690.1 hypothetical protein BCT46_14875 [Vibrio sp. 10N.261.46.E8]